MLADCLHDLAALGPGSLPALMAAMFLAGLAGGLVHCALMCAPFVLAQSADGSGAGGPALQRLAGAMLLPYQAGRALGYGLLGALAGGLAGLFALGTGLRWMLGALLLLAALLMAAQALPRLAAGLPRLRAPPARLGRWVALLLVWPSPLRGLLLGLLLSGLPCGLLYAALAAAAASGSALAGGLAMLAFVLGTVPALTALALFGRLLRRVQGTLMRQVTGGLFLLNAVVLTGLALRLFNAR